MHVLPNWHPLKLWGSRLPFRMHACAMHLQPHPGELETNYVSVELQVR